MTSNGVKIRNLSPSDYDAIIGVVDDWWGGQRMASMLPRLFFEHFTDTSFAAEAHGSLAGFLVGFCSPSRRGEAYIHFVGAHPAQRGQGLGRRLYEAFFEAVAARGCTIVRAVTAPMNSGSIAFHRRIGFEIERGGAESHGFPVTVGYDGPGHDRVRFIKHLRPVPTGRLGASEVPGASSYTCGSQRQLHGLMRQAPRSEGLTHEW
jgi:GNAT superfamily N-acetyltransferase